MPSRKKLRPFRQGSLDNLCGLYALINASRLAMPEITSDECIQVFQKAMAWICAHKKCSAILHGGLNINYVLGLHKAVFRKQWPAISLHRPFLRTANRPQNAKAFWRRMEEEASNTEQGIFFGFQGRGWDHWSVLRKITPEKILLFDSERKHPLQRKHCGHTQEDAAEYVIGPEYILFLRKIIESPDHILKG